MIKFTDCFQTQGAKDHLLTSEVSRKRQITTYSQHGGIPCNFSALEEKKSCSDAYDGVEVLFFC